MMTKQEFLFRAAQEIYPSIEGAGASAEQVSLFREQCLKLYGVELDSDYLDLLLSLNGFDMNGLSFYGVVADENRYVESFIDKNNFWRTELPSLSQYVLLGDGDLDFLGLSTKTGKYVALYKDDLSIFGEYNSLNSLLASITSRYM